MVDEREGEPLRQRAERAAVPFVVLGRSTLRVLVSLRETLDPQLHARELIAVQEIDATEQKRDNRDLARKMGNDTEATALTLELCREYVSRIIKNYEVGDHGGLARNIRWLQEDTSVLGAEFDLAHITPPEDVPVVTALVALPPIIDEP